MIFISLFDCWVGSWFVQNLPVQEDAIKFWPDFHEFLKKHYMDLGEGRCHLSLLMYSIHIRVFQFVTEN